MAAKVMSQAGQGGVPQGVTSTTTMLLLMSWPMLSVATAPQPCNQREHVIRV